MNIRLLNFTLLFIFSLSALIAQEDQNKENEKYDIIVDRNGRGNYRNIQDAVESIRAFKPEGLVRIFVRDGVYKEKIIIPNHLCNIHILGESKDNTIITYDDHANINNMGTFRTYTLLIQGNDIILENLTVENNSQQLGQAVALHTEGDRLMFINCKFLGHQDTIYVGREAMRCYFYNCYIEGTTDFIFGPSTCWFEKCTIHCKKNSYITAASTPEHIKYGLIFNNCTVSIEKDIDNVYLGRPWRPYAMTLFMNTYLPKEIAIEGWHNWGKIENEQTARYMEFHNIGPGASTDKRVKWDHLLTKKQAEQYTIGHVLQGCDNWELPLMK